MSALSVRKTYDDGTDPTEQQLDDIRESIEEFFNVTQVTDDNIQDDGITASTKLVDASISAEKIGSSAATTAKFIDGSVTAAKITDGAVTTAKLANSNVTRAKMAAANYGVSSNITGNYTSDTDTLAATTLLTTSGRPVRITMAPISGGGSTGPYVMTSTSSTSPANNSRMIFKLYRDGVQIDGCILAYQAPGIGHIVRWPGTVLNFYDFTPSAGAHTYTLYVATFSSVGGVTLSFEGVLLAYEL
jgi:hypothetical protein